MRKSLKAHSRAHVAMLIAAALLVAVGYGTSHHSIADPAGMTTPEHAVADAHGHGADHGSGSPALAAPFESIQGACDSMCGSPSDLAMACLMLAIAIIALAGTIRAPRLTRVIAMSQRTMHVVCSSVWPPTRPHLHVLGISRT